MLELREFLDKTIKMSRAWQDKCIDGLFSFIEKKPMLDIYAFDDYLHTLKGFENYEDYGLGMEQVINKLYKPAVCKQLREYLGV